MTKITKEVAMKLQYRDTLHRGRCKIREGPRGGLTLDVETWRVNGKCKTWKTKPEAFEIPIKHGFGNYSSDYSYINDLNAHEFHLSTECVVEDDYIKRKVENAKRNESTVLD